MDWIWSSRCLALLCTSTQSNNLKWVSGGGINSPRHPKSRWLTASKKVSIGRTDAILFKASVHLVPLPHHLDVEVLWQNYSDVMHRRCVGSSGAEEVVLARLCLDSNWALDRPTVSSLRPSDHPVLLFSLLLLCNSSATTKKWTVGSYDGAFVFTQCTNSSDHCTDACYLGTVGSSDGVLSFSFLSCFWPLKNRLSSQFGMWYFGILGT
jgi:hypothetical protein